MSGRPTRPRGGFATVRGEEGRTGPPSPLWSAATVRARPRGADGAPLTLAELFGPNDPAADAEAQALAAAAAAQARAAASSGSNASTPTRFSLWRYVDALRELIRAHSAGADAAVELSLKAVLVGLHGFLSTPQMGAAIAQLVSERPSTPQRTDLPQPSAESSRTQRPPLLFTAETHVQVASVLVDLAHAALPLEEVAHTFLARVGSHFRLPGPAVLDWISRMTSGSNPNHSSHSSSQESGRRDYDGNSADSLLPSGPEPRTPPASFLGGVAQKNLTLAWLHHGLEALEEGGISATQMAHVVMSVFAALYLAVRAQMADLLENYAQSRRLAPRRLPNPYFYATVGSGLLAMLARHGKALDRTLQVRALALVFAHFSPDSALDVRALAIDDPSLRLPITDLRLHLLLAFDAMEVPPSASLAADGRVDRRLLLAPPPSPLRYPPPLGVPASPTTSGRWNRSGSLYSSGGAGLSPEDPTPPLSANTLSASFMNLPAAKHVSPGRFPVLQPHMPPQSVLVESMSVSSPALAVGGSSSSPPSTRKSAQFKAPFPLRCSLLCRRHDSVLAQMFAGLEDEYTQLKSEGLPSLESCLSALAAATLYSTSSSSNATGVDSHGSLSSPPLASSSLSSPPLLSSSNSPSSNFPLANNSISSSSSSSSASMASISSSSSSWTAGGGVHHSNGVPSTSGSGTPLGTPVAWVGTLRPRRTPRAGEEFVRELAGSSEFPQNLAESYDALKSVARRTGIPPELRGRLWGGLAVASAFRRQLCYPCILLHAETVASPFVAQIEKDLLRTFPNETGFEDGAADGVLSLRRILVAYSWVNPEVGYCQSMNFLCALLLMYMDESEAFYTFTALLDHVLPRSYYMADMRGILVDAKVFQQLLHARLPRLASHLTALGLELEPVLHQWFLCAFVTVLPFDVVVRVWDNMLLQGAKVLFRCALGIFKMYEREFLASRDLVDAYQLVRQLPARVPAAEFLDCAFSSAFSSLDRGNRSVDRVRLTVALQMEAEIGASSSGRASELFQSCRKPRDLLLVLARASPNPRAAHRPQQSSRNAFRKLSASLYHQAHAASSSSSSPTHGSTALHATSLPAELPHSSPPPSSETRAATQMGANGSTSSAKIDIPVRLDRPASRELDLRYSSRFRPLSVLLGSSAPGDLHLEETSLSSND